MGKKENSGKVSSLSNDGSVSDRKVYVFILLFSFLLYGNTIKNDFSLDDEYVSRNNDQIMKGISAIPEILTSYYTAGSRTKDMYGYRPIVKVTYAIEYSLFGENPHVSHFVNILLYAFLGMLIFSLLNKWLKDYNRILPLLITVIFLAHPIHTEVVASIKNRDVLLTIIAGFLILRYTIRYLEHNKIKDLGWATFWTVFSYMSKQETPAFFSAIPFITYYFTNASLKKSIAVGFYLGFIFVVCFYLTDVFLPRTMRAAGDMEYHDNPLYFNKDFMIRLGVTFNSLLSYLQMVFIHYPMRYFYGYNTIPVEPVYRIMPALSLLMHIGMGMYALFNLKGKNIVAFGIVWYLMFISFFSNLLSPAPGIIAERFVFSASFGFCIVLAYYLLKFTGVNFQTASKKIAYNQSFIVVTGIILLLFTGQTISRNTDWKDQLTLFRHDMQHLENSVKGHEMLGATLMTASLQTQNEEERARIVNEAMIHYHRSVEIYPDFAMGHNNIGAFYSNLFNDCKKANYYFKEALRVNKKFGEAYINMGLCYARLAKVDSAIVMLEHGVALEKGKFMIPYTTLMALYFQKGESEKAKRILYEAAASFPDSEIPYREMGNQYLAKKDTLEAVKYFELAIKKKPDPGLSNSIMEYYRIKGNSEKANEHRPR